MQLCLGTVQFGMNYGIFNDQPKDIGYCVKCIDYATQNGVYAIDTAAAYGNAEEIVGSFIRKKTISRNSIFISTKLFCNILDVCEKRDYKSIILDNIKKSLKKIGTDYVDAYFLHSSRYAHDIEILEALQEVKKQGLARNVGVSIYYEDEAEACSNNTNVGYVQLPYSIFDHRMKNAGLINRLVNNNTKVDSRTAFVKGLIRLKDEEIPEYLSKARPILKKLDEICKKTGYSRIELAVGYVKKEELISHLVFGVRDIDQLKEDIAAFNIDIPSEIFNKIDEEFKGIDADIVVPSLWGKK